LATGLILWLSAIAAISPIAQRSQHET